MKSKLVLRPETAAEVLNSKRIKLLKELQEKRLSREEVRSRLGGQGCKELFETGLIDYEDGMVYGVDELIVDFADNYPEKYMPEEYK